MKNIFFVILMTFLFPAFLNAGKMNVVDYYLLFQKEGGDFKKGFNNYDILKNGGDYVFEEPEYGTISGVVDLQNYYVKSEYQGGDGESISVFAVYLSSYGNDVVGISTYDNITGGKYAYAFLRYTNNKWKDVGDEVIPKIEDDLFFDYKYDLTEYEKIKTRNNYFTLQRTVEIPRYGTVTKYGIYIPQVSDFETLDAKDKKGVFEFGKKVP